MYPVDQSPSQVIEQESYVPEREPNVSKILEEAILAKQAANDDVLRIAAMAESRGESNKELEAVIDTIIGIKLLGMKAGDEEVVRNAEQIFIDSNSGDATQEEIAVLGLETILHHDPGNTRKDQHIEYLQSVGLTEEDIKELYDGPEQLSYQHLSIVHSTNHLPRRSKDGTRHIDDRFTSSGHSRSTVHVALNARVESSPFSADWSGQKFIVVAPMDEVVELNGNPTSLIGHDTWWETIPGKGLALPSDAIVIKPGATKVVQYLPNSGEIAYKNDGITPDDADTLMAMASDYELSQLANTLGVHLHLEYNHHSSRNLGDTSLEQYSTELSIDQRRTIAERLHGLLADEPAQGVYGFTELAKLVAVRLALTLQGREIIEPRTTMDSHFMSQDVDDELTKLAVEQGSTGGHHSESTVGKLEHKVRQLVHRGTFTGDAEDRIYITQEIRENIDQIDRGTLHMYYRLGLL